MAKLSIHALREESDHFNTSFLKMVMTFYPRSPRGERRCITVDGRTLTSTFLSTLSARRATISLEVFLIPQESFYPRSPRGERHSVQPQCFHTSSTFYPRSPRGERPAVSIWDWTSAFAFYPRSPRGERRKRCLPHSLKAGLSIHALREESDRTVETLLIPLGELSIHALREESDSHGTARIGVELCLSIHALREESDNIWLCMRGIIANFLSTLSARRATHFP